MIGLHSSSQQLLLPKPFRQSATQPADKKDGGQERRRAGPPERWRVNPPNGRRAGPPERWRVNLEQKSVNLI